MAFCLELLQRFQPEGGSASVDAVGQIVGVFVEQKVRSEHAIHAQPIDAPGAVIEGGIVFHAEQITGQGGRAFPVFHGL